MQKLLIPFALLLLTLAADAQVNYDSTFTKKALRIDFYLAGNADTTMVFEKDYKQEPYWGGGPLNLVSPLNYGDYRISVFDTATQKLIYRRGKSILFREWKMTEEAQYKNRSFYQTFRIPYPRKPIRYRIEERNYNTGNYQMLYEAGVDPKSYRINRREPPAYPVDTLGPFHQPDSVADIVVLPEGYTREEMPEFIEDAERVRQFIFSYEPFQSHQETFNFYAVRAASADSGTTIPGDSVYKNTLLRSSFYTFDVPRYLTSQDTRTIRDIAGLTPYDHIIVLVNSTRYGGGGFYNHLTLTTARGPMNREVSVHEFGHGFAGLGDEYYNSEVATSELYNTDVEPWEPNITTLVDFERKWKAMVDTGLPVPTPRTKAYADTVGVFEGGGYVAKGIFSPSQDCRMKSNVADAFCPVCQQAILKMIRFYSEQIPEKYVKTE